MADVLKAQDVNFALIKSLIGNSLSVHDWPVDNGANVRAQVKVTIRNGLIKTAYLHATITQPNGAWEYYKECANKAYKRIAVGRAQP